MKILFLIKVFAILFFNTTFPVLMNLQDALTYAKNSGIPQEDMSIVEKYFKQYTNKNLEIDDLQMVQVVSGFLAQKEREHKEKEINFDAYFNQTLKEIEQLKNQARALEQKGEDSLDVQLKASKIINDLNEAIQKKSTSKWFYSGDLLPYILKLHNYETIETAYGKSFAVDPQIKANIKTPIVHLVSHNQIFPTCGFNTLANAYALEQQVRSNKKVNAAETQKIAEQFFTTFLEKQTEFTNCQIQGKFEEPEFGDLQTVVAKNKNIFGKDFDLRIIHSTYMSPESKKEIAQKLHDEKVVHFIFHTGGHFDLATVVHEGNTYTIFFLNSTNAAPSKSTEGQYFILLDELIAMAQKLAQEKKEITKPIISTMQKEPGLKKEVMYPQERKKQLINDAIVLIKEKKIEEVVNNIASQASIWKEILGGTEQLQEFLKLLFTKNYMQAIKILEGYKE